MEVRFLKTGARFRAGTKTYELRRVGEFSAWVKDVAQEADEFADRGATCSGGGPISLRTEVEELLFDPPEPVSFKDAALEREERRARREAKETEQAADLEKYLRKKRISKEKETCEEGSNQAVA